MRVLGQKVSNAYRYLAVGVVVGAVLHRQLLCGAPPACDKAATATVASTAPAVEPLTVAMDADGIENEKEIEMSGASVPSSQAVNYCSTSCAATAACVNDGCACDLGYSGSDCGTYDPLDITSDTEETMRQMEGIYERNGWNSRYTKSGPGSEVRASTRMAEGLLQVITLYKVKHMFDGGCGDLHWLRHIKFPPRFLYTGCDVAKTQIDALREWFGPKELRNEEAGFGLSTYNEFSSDSVEYKGDPKYRPEMSFYHCDVSAVTLDFAPDLVLLRDLTFHIPTQNTRMAIKNFIAAGAKYLLATFFLEATNEKLCTYSGDFCEISFLKPPFEFPNPRFIIQNVELRSKCVGLWLLADLEELPFIKNDYQP